MRVRIIPGLRRASLTEDEWLRLLAKFNGNQRIKNREEQTREELALIDPAEAHVNLVTQRAERAKIWTPTMVIPDARRRKEISGAKREFLAAVRQVLAEVAAFLPLSVRAIHYMLLNLSPGDEPQETRRALLEHAGVLQKTRRPDGPGEARRDDRHERHLRRDTAS